MEDLKSWAVCAVASAAVAAVVDLLAPQGGSEKPMKFITSVFVLLAFISPFADFEPLEIGYSQGIDDFIEAYELEQAVEQQAKDALSSQIVSSLGAYIESLGVSYSEIDVKVDIDSDKNISIDRITVLLVQADSYAEQKISEYAKENYGVEPRFEE